MPKSVKNALRNSFFQTFGAFTITGLNFALMLIYARVLGPEGLGDLATSQARVLLWIAFVDLGLSNALIGALTAAEGGKDELARQGFRARDLLNRVLAIRFGGAFLGTVCIWFLAKQHATGPDGIFNEQIFWQEMAYVPHLFAIALILTADAYCKFRGRQGLGVAAVLTGVVVTVVIPAYLAYKGASITWLLLSQSWGGILSALIIWIAFRIRPTCVEQSIENTRRPGQRTKKIFRTDWGVAAWKALVRDAWPYAIMFGAIVLWQRVDLLVASEYLGLVETGQYVLAVRLSAFPILVATSVGHALFPDLQRVGMDAPEKLITYLGTLSKFLFRYGILIGAGILLVLALLIYPFFPKYKPALVLLPWFLPGIWAYWMYSFIVGVLFGLRRYKEVVSCYVGATIVYLLCLVPLVKALGLPGVALGSGLFSISMFVGVFLVMKRLKIMPAEFRMSGSYTADEKAMLVYTKAKLRSFFPGFATKA